MFELPLNLRENQVSNCVFKQAIASGKNWEINIGLSDSLKEEIVFWGMNIKKLNHWSGQNSKKPSIISIISSDASSSGCGSVLSGTDTLAARLFSEQERAFHSTKRELLAGLHALESFLPKISHSLVKLKLDNQSSAKIIDSGSGKKDLQEIAIKIFHLCWDNGISLEVEWIPREENEAADLASREANIVDVDDWQITEEFFKYLNGK